MAKIVLGAGSSHTPMLLASDETLPRFLETDQKIKHRDKEGRPTTDAKAAMEGSMLALGAATSSKGAMLALVVELLVTALTGAHFGAEASSFFVDEGDAPRIGQAFLLIDPGAMAGREVYLERVEALVTEMLVDEGVRLAGARRLALERQARREGIELPAGL